MTAWTCIPGKLPPQLSSGSAHTWSHAPSSSTFTKTLTWPNVSQFIPSTAGISNNGKSSAIAERRCMPLHDSVILQREMQNLWLSCTIRIVLVLIVVENHIYLRNLFTCSLMHSRIILWDVLKKQILLFRCCKSRVMFLEEIQIDRNESKADNRV